MTTKIPTILDRPIEEALKEFMNHTQVEANAGAALDRACRSRVDSETTLQRLVIAHSALSTGEAIGKSDARRLIAKMVSEANRA